MPSVVKVEGKIVTVPDEIVALGKEAIRAALSVDFPAIENAQIEIVKEAGAPTIVTVSKRATPKGQAYTLPTEQALIVDLLTRTPAYVNPAIELASEVMSAEARGDREFFESLVRRGDVERAISESNREGQAVADALFKVGHAVPTTSLDVPVGF